MNRKRQRHIESIAEKLVFGKYWPINVQDMAESCGCKVHPYDFGDKITGLYTTVNDKKIIGVHSSLKTDMANWVVAHSLGHCVLGHLSHNANNLFFDNMENYFTIIYTKGYSKDVRVWEREANAFAGALLMPTFLLQTAISMFGESLKSSPCEPFDMISFLSQLFEVPYQFVAFRLSTKGMLW